MKPKWTIIQQAHWRGYHAGSGKRLRQAFPRRVAMKKLTICGAKKWPSRWKMKRFLMIPPLDSYWRGLSIRGIHDNQQLWRILMMTTTTASASLGSDDNYNVAALLFTTASLRAKALRSVISTCNMAVMVISLINSQHIIIIVACCLLRLSTCNKRRQKRGTGN